MKAIITKYVPPTNYRGSKVKASEERQSVTLDWSSELNSDENHQAAAKALCAKMNWHGRLVMGGMEKFNVHCFVESWTESTEERSVQRGKHRTVDTYTV